MSQLFASSGQSTGVSYGEKMETVTVFIFLGSKVTADRDCSHETETHFLFERKTDKSRMYESHSVVSDSLGPHKLYSPWSLKEPDTAEQLYFDFDSFYSSQSCMSVRVGL